MAESVAVAAGLLSAGRLLRQRLTPLPEDCRPLDEASAYEVQEALHRMLTARGYGGIAGHKIGCTTPVMQAYLGIPNPCAGGIFDTTVQRADATFRHTEFLHAGVECEIAVRLGSDLPLSLAPFDFDKVADAVDACMAAIEVVDDRYMDYKTLDTPTLIADDFFNAACVLGQPVTDWLALNLAEVTGTTRINGVEAGRGKGADVMEHPFEALAWLANQMAGRGKVLRRGEFVLTGSVVETRWVNAGDEVEVTLSGLGTVRARFLG